MRARIIAASLVASASAAAQPAEIEVRELMVIDIADPTSGPQTSYTSCDLAP